MPSLTLSVPRDLKEKMEEFPEINWSEVARQAIMHKTRILEKMESLLSKSTLAEEDVLKQSHDIKKAVLKRHRG